MSRLTSEDWIGPVWKLTDSDGFTHEKSCQWGRRVANPHGVKDGERALCSPSWYHGYDNAYLAVLMNPIHAKITSPRLWLAEWRGARLDDRGLKFGATELRTLREVKVPVITPEQRVAFAIFCAGQVLDEASCPTWHDWAHGWMCGEDRSTNAANAAYAANANPSDVLENAIAWALTIAEDGR